MIFSLESKIPIALQIGKERKFKIKLKQSIELKQKKPSLIRKSKDGKKYIVFSEYNKTQQTINAHPDAVCREYWIPYKEESPTHVILLNKFGESVSDDIWVELQGGNLELLSNYK